MTTPTIPQGNKFMDATLYTGTGASLAVTNAGGFQPDLVWVKSRSAATDHKLTDSVRGVTKALISDTTGAETTDTQGLTAFGSGGFTVGTNTDYNNSAATYVGWQWKAGGTAASNTSGTITSSVSANTTAGFSIVTYTATGTAATLGHGLGVAPQFMIVKCRSSTLDWIVYHTSIGATNYLTLNTTNASAALSSIWNNTAPTSSVLSIGTDAGVNSNGQTYVAYCWTPIAGYSAFGSYTGNGSSDGPFIYLGFRPKFVMFKRTDSTGAWYILDTSINSYNEARTSLQANSSAAEVTDTNFLDILSNGFKLRTSGAAVNGSGGTYIYMAFCENPFKYSLAR